MNRFIIDGNSDSISKHWKYCESNNLPCINAKKLKKYYYVEMDYLSSNYQLSEEGIELVRKLWEEEFDILEMKPIKGVGVRSSSGPRYPYFEKILPSRVESVCNKLFDISQRYRSPKE